MRWFLLLIAPCSLLILITGCSKPADYHSIPRATPYTLTIPKHFPTKLNIPSDNPLTVEGIALGRFLFYDGRLSGRTHPDSLMTCATCHIQANGFECGAHHPTFPGGRPHGLSGVATPHVMLPLINLVWNDRGYLWNGAVGPAPAGGNIEDIVLATLTDPNELAGDTARIAALFQSLPGYPGLFEKAFGSPRVTAVNIARAIAQFVRTLVSANSRFDRFLRGEINLSASERNGYVIFMTEQGGDCFHCHGGEGNPLFTTHLCYNNGKDSVFTDPLDRYSVTGAADDIGAYKAPTLRNLAFTAPYMHDGRYRTIDEVLAFYNAGLVRSPSISPLMHHIATGGVRLTPSKLADLKAFVLTLTDSSFVANPAFSRPLRFPDEN
ncbi:MAG TPA: cytochrome c peroxidase [Bacteroidales bacterium]|nr:cytochrome c peroxidase [Bacteroidales bacterium]HPS62986.1 cytochrome c peroxidase [Bacteroidales bacterium]